MVIMQYDKNTNERVTLTSNEIAKLLGISRGTFYRLAKAKNWFIHLPGINRRRLYPVTQLERFLNQSKKESQHESTKN